MNQILNIFRKDTRRFWPEIVLSLVITAAFALIYPVQWLPGTGERVRELQYLASVFTGLVPVSWWLLIGRVVHAETLVGDRQFWITRPYEWKKLLGAKVLFLLVWLCWRKRASIRCRMSRACSSVFCWPREFWCCRCSPSPRLQRTLRG